MNSVVATITQLGNATLPGADAVIEAFNERADKLGTVGITYRAEAQALFLQAAYIADTYGQCTPFARLVAKLGPHERKVAVQYVTKYTPVSFRADGTAYLARGAREWDHDGMAAVKWYDKHTEKQSKLRGVEDLVNRVRTVARSDDPGAWTDEAVELANKFIELAKRLGYVS